MRSRKICLCVLAILLCLVSVTTSISQGIITVNKRLNSTGTISASTGTARKLYSTDFESITRHGTRPSGSLDMGEDANGVLMQQTWVFEPEPAETNWIEPTELNTGVRTHSGTKCIGIQTGDGSSYGKRVEFEISHIQDHFGGNIYGKEMYTSIWVFFPSTWTLTSSDGWYALGNPFSGKQEPWEPVTETHLHNYGGLSSAVEWGQPNGPPEYPQTTLGTSSYFPPIGEWWRYETYIYFHDTGGKVKVWFNGNLICDVSDIETIGYSGQDMLVNIAKNYHDSTSKIFTMYVDDFELWDGMPNVGTSGLKEASVNASMSEFQTDRISSNASIMEPQTLFTSVNAEIDSSVPCPKWIAQSSLTKSAHT